MILTGPSIQSAVENGLIRIDPFEPSRINPASYDLTLGDEVATYSATDRNISYATNLPVSGLESNKKLLDSARAQSICHARMAEAGFTIHPGRLYLMHTAEIIFTRKFVPVIDGKSSIGRLGLLIHCTAGYGDPGFNGQYTLEVTSVAHPVVVYPGMRFAQVRFHAHSETANDRQLLQSYEGNYRGAAARGPVPSASWRQFEKSDKPGS